MNWKNSSCASVLQPPSEKRTQYLNLCYSRKVRFCSDCSDFFIRQEPRGGVFFWDFFSIIFFYYGRAWSRYFKEGPDYEFDKWGKKKKITHVGGKQEFYLVDASDSPVRVLNLTDGDSYPNMRKLFEIARSRTSYFRYREIENSIQKYNGRWTRGNLNLIKLQISEQNVIEPLKSSYRKY